LKNARKKNLLSSRSMEITSAVASGGKNAVNKENVKCQNSKFKGISNDKCQKIERLLT
jgi:hypothetical protein